MSTPEGTKKACQRCLRTTNHTCAACRKHRPCELNQSGRWICKVCTDIGEALCGTCFKPMAAGNGKRCQQCYWTERCTHKAMQLVELLTSKRVREAFMTFTQWLPTQSTAQRAALHLSKHADFFVLLEGCGEVPWTEGLLLSHFGPKVLRRYELPVRWLQSHTSVRLTPEEKTREADTRRVRNAVAQMPKGSMAREILTGFEQELERRRAVGKITERSMRLAFRPALALLIEEDANGGRLPSQNALERYLAHTPGQRAAISTFIGFLKLAHGADLRIPSKVFSSVEAHKSLEKRIIDLIETVGNEERVIRQWAPLALRYFHRLSSKDAKTICTDVKPLPSDGGFVYSYQAQDYWIPQRPMLLKMG